jgi:hypothetical protein
MIVGIEHVMRVNKIHLGISCISLQWRRLGKLVLLLVRVQFVAGFLCIVFVYEARVDIAD